MSAVGISYISDSDGQDNGFSPLRDDPLELEAGKATELATKALAAPTVSAETTKAQESRRFYPKTATLIATLCAFITIAALGLILAKYLP